MSFQIVNSNNEPISIKQLDAEAAEFWLQPISDIYYAFPQHREEGEKEWDFITRQHNWFSCIGHMIHNPEAENQSSDKWDCVKIGLMTLHFKFVALKPLPELTESLMYTQLHLLPYFSLIDHWKAKGYQPKRVEE